MGMRERVTNAITRITVFGAISRHIDTGRAACVSCKPAYCISISHLLCFCRDLTFNNGSLVIHLQMWAGYRTPVVIANPKKFNTGKHLHIKLAMQIVTVIRLAWKNG